MKRAIVPLAIIAALAGGYLLTASITDVKIRTVRARLALAGLPVSVAETEPWFSEGSDSAAAALVAAEAAFPKELRQRFAAAPFDSVGRLPVARRELLAALAPAIDRVSEAAAMGPANFGVDFRAGMNAKLPGVLKAFGPFRRLLLVTARQLVADGRYDSAATMIAASIAMSHTFAEPFVIFSTAEVVGIEPAFDLAAEVAPKLSPEARALLAAEFARLDPSADLARSLAAEGPMVQQSLARGETFGPFDEEGDAAVLTTPAITLLPLRRIAQLGQLEGEERQLALLALPWCRGRRLLEEYDREFGGRGWIARVRRFGVMNPRPLYLRMERIAARRDVALVGLAVLEFRLRTGRLPSVLAEAAADFPTDRFSGEPLRYLPLADGFAVYSVGSDETDGGGDSLRDIVFRVRL